MQTPSPLQALPAELIGMISRSLNNKSLLAMRSTCRDLCGGSAREFCHRFLDLVEISGTWDSVLDLNAVLSSRNLPYAQHKVKKLVVSAPLLKRSEKYEEPDTTDVARLVRAMPNLTTVKLVDDMNVDKQIRNAKTARIFLTHLAQLPSQVRRLELFAVEVDGDLLANMLEAHKNALLLVSLNEVTLDSQFAWQYVLKLLYSARIKRLELAWLRHTNQDAGTEHLSIPKPPINIINLRQKGGGRAFVSDTFIEAHRTCVKPALKILLERLEDAV
jgi:hypothetical protein